VSAGLLSLLAFALPAAAAGVALAGRMGDKALLVIAGQTRVLGVGQSLDGVRLLRWEGELAVVEDRGQVLQLRIAATPLTPPSASAAQRVPAREVVIPAGAGGHFVTDGEINGRAVRFMVDTGATLVSLGRDEAIRIGLDLRQARPAIAHTAGGQVPVELVTLARLRVGEVELAGVPAVVTPAAMPYVLLGNSVLERFQMRRENDVLRLELR
jgi:aspartyl protease family protein